MTKKEEEPPYIVPDLIFEDEDEDFRTGLYNLPARFQRTFLNDTLENNILYQTGETEDVNVQQLHRRIEKYVLDDAPEITRRDELLSTLISPKSIKSVRYNRLGYALTPKPETYYSLRRIRWLMIEPESTTIKEANRGPYDPVPNNQKVIDELKQKRFDEFSNKPLRLSHIIKYLHDLNNQQPFDIVLSACRTATKRKILDKVKPTAKISIDELRAVKRNNYQDSEKSIHRRVRHRLPTYMLSCHGNEDDQRYELPSGVRVFMLCRAGKPVIASSKNEAKLWYASTFPEYNGDLSFLRDMRLYDDDDEYRQFCAFGRNVQHL